jgi:hypothetical protein
MEFFFLFRWERARVRARGKREAPSCRQMTISFIGVSSGILRESFGLPSEKAVISRRTPEQVPKMKSEISLLYSKLLASSFQLWDFDFNSDFPQLSCRANENRYSMIYIASCQQPEASGLQAEACSLQHVASPLLTFASWHHPLLKSSGSKKIINCWY